MPRTGDFSVAVGDSLRDSYQNRCAICLNRQASSECECSHIFDLSTEGKRLVYNASYLGVIESNFDRNSAANGISMCGTCHRGYFAPNYTALCPAIKVLDYLIQTLQNNPESGSAPPSVLEIFKRLGAVVTDRSAPPASPDIIHVLPFLHLFILVPLEASELRGLELVTRSFPPLYICRNNTVSLAEGHDLCSEDAFHLFDAQSTHPPAYGRIPLDAEDPEYPQQRYWNLPDTRPEVILGALMIRIAADFGNRHPAIVKVRQITALLDQRADLQDHPIAGDHMSELNDTALSSPDWRFGPQSTHANIYFATGNRLTGIGYGPPMEYLVARSDED